MSKKLEVIKGTSNPFADFGYKDADVEYLKAKLAGEIIKVLDKQKLSVRKAEERTGINYSDFSRIRNTDIGRFTIDRLVKILNRLNWRVEVKVSPIRKSSRRKVLTPA